MLFSIVAWDHVSWPGNDFFVGSRCTDSMAALAGIVGQYDATLAAYLPPVPFNTWEQVVSKWTPARGGWPWVRMKGERHAP